MKKLSEETIREIADMLAWTYTRHISMKDEWYPRQDAKNYLAWGLLKEYHSGLYKIFKYNHLICVFDEYSLSYYMSCIPGEHKIYDIVDIVRPFLQKLEIDFERFIFCHRWIDDAAVMVNVTPIKDPKDRYGACLNNTYAIRINIENNSCGSTVFRRFVIAAIDDDIKNKLLKKEV